MNAILTPRQLELLQTVCAEGVYAPLLAKVVASTMSDQEVETLCALISNEMMMNGVEETFEPNVYGKELEKLLDVVNRKRLSS